MPIVQKRHDGTAYLAIEGCMNRYKHIINNNDTLQSQTTMIDQHTIIFVLTFSFDSKNTKFIAH